MPPDDSHVEPVRRAGPQRGAVVPTLVVLGALSAVAGMAVLGREESPGVVRLVIAERSAALGRPPPTVAPSQLPILAIRNEQPRVVLPRIIMPRPGPDETADGPAGTSRLRVLSWQADPYES